MELKPSPWKRNFWTAYNQCHKSTIQHWKVLNIGELVGWLVCWFVGWLVGWFVRQNWIKEHCSGENLHRWNHNWFKEHVSNKDQATPSTDINQSKPFNGWAFPIWASWLLFGGWRQGCTTCVTFSQPELTQNHFHYKSAMIKQFAKNLTFCDKKWQSLNGFLSL